MRVVLADDHGESVFEAERFGEFEIESSGVLLFDAIVDGGGIVCSRGFVENGGEGCTGVFDVEIEIAGEKGLVDEEGAAEIGFALDGDVGAGFDVLGEQLGKDDLLGEKFGADGQVGLRGLAAGGDEVEEVKEPKEAKEWAAHVESANRWNWEFNTEVTENTEMRKRMR